MSVKERLSVKFQIDRKKILTIPFYPPLVSKSTNNKKTNYFLYVSEGHPHKNLIRLLDAFSKFYRKHQIGELHLTVSFENLNLCDKINNFKNSGIPVINHGFQKRDMLIQLYQTSEFLIYPSLAESFGLGIIEGIENGCTIIGADLPYLYSACEPSIVFDPKSVSDIASAFEKAVLRDFNPSKQLLFNDIDKLIKLLVS
jgi:glycosyltransferase involved in cell wall biosynthesis